MEQSLNVYGEIASERDEWLNSDAFIPSDLQDALSGLVEGDTLTLYINSPGGEVFAAAAMTSIIKRAQSKGVTVNAVIDGLAASAASFLVMACDSVSMYDSAMLMVHKPSTLCWGNADDLLSTAEMLEKIENSTMMPLYMGKAKVGEEEVKDLIKAETWMGASEAEETFEIERIEGAKVAAKFDRRFFANYKHAPEQLIKAEQPEEKPVDLSDLKNRIAEL